MKTMRLGLVSALTLMLLWLTPLKALCQDVEMEPMTVTAEKREENIQKVPQSVTLLSGLRIEDSGSRDAQEVSRLMPNAYMAATGAENILSIRGVSSFDTALYSPAGFFVDGAGLPLHYMYNAELYDVERVETLRGPQGTLYGRNTESGLIHVVTRQPDNQLRARVFGEYSSFETFRCGGNVSGPMVRDKAYAGVALVQKNSHGFMENDYSHDDETATVDRFNGRASLRVTPTGALDIAFTADALETDDGLGVYRYAAGPKKTDYNHINQDAKLESSQSGHGQTLTAKVHSPYCEVVSISAWRAYNHGFTTDNDFSPQPLESSSFDYSDDVFSQEVRVASPDNGAALKWLIGGYGFSEQTDVDYNRSANWRLISSMDNSGWAGFGQATWTLAQRLHLTGGVRFDHQDMEGDLLDATFKKSFSKDMDHDEWLPRFSISYDKTEEVMLYASLAEGFLSGGYNYGLSRRPESFTYGPEFTWNYEIGAKASLQDGKIVLSAAVFYIDIKDKQVFEVDPAIFATQIRNAAEAHSTGFEAEVRVRPMQGLDLFGGFGYASAKFDEWTATEFNSTYTGLAAYDYKGKRLPNAPEYTGNAGAMYRHSTGFFIRGDVFFNGDFYADAKNTAKQEAYELVNLRAGFESSHVDAALWCENLFDTKYAKAKYAWGVDELCIDGAPVTVGGTVTLRY